jgi:hypothetical protein
VFGVLRWSISKERASTRKIFQLFDIKVNIFNRLAIGRCTPLFVLFAFVVFPTGNVCQVVFHPLEPWVLSLFCLLMPVNKRNWREYCIATT